MIEYVITFLISIIQLLSFYYCFTTLKNCKLKISKETIFLILIICLIESFLINVNPFYKIMIITLLLVILYYLLIQNDLYLSFINSIYLSLINLSADFLFTIIIKYVLLDLISIHNIKYMLSFALTLFLVMLFKIKPFISFSKKIINYIYKNKNLFLFLIISIILYSFFGYVFFTIVYYNFSLVYSLILLICIILILFFTQFLFYKNEKNKLYNSNLSTLNNFYGTIIDNDKQFKHSLKSKLLAIKDISNDKEVKKLISELINDSSYKINPDNELYKVPKKLLGLFASKLYNYNDISLFVINRMNDQTLNNMNIKTFYNLYQTLSIILDNCVEAVYSLDDSYIKISFYEDKEHLYISILNNYTNLIDLDTIGNKNYSTKNRNSGYGLYSILKNKNINVNVNVINNNFEVKLKIKKRSH